MISLLEASTVHVEDIPMPSVIGSFRVVKACNQAYCDLFGYERDQIIGKSFAAIYLNYSEYLQSGIIWNEHLQTHHQYVDERIMRKNSGETFWCRVNGRTLRPRKPTSLAIWLVQPLARPVKTGVTDLTRKQRQMITLVSQGKSNRDIATELGISVRTAETHRTRIMKKIGVANAAELVAWYAGLHDLEHGG